MGHFSRGACPRLRSPRSCTNSGARPGKGRRERRSGGQQEPCLRRLKQPCRRVCNRSLGGSRIVPLLQMISFWNFPFACLLTEADQSLGTCVCFLPFCFWFFSWSVTEQYHYSGSNKKSSLEFLQKRAGWCSLFGVCREFAAVALYHLFFLPDCWCLR